MSISPAAVCYSESKRVRKTESPAEGALSGAPSVFWATCGTSTKPFTTEGTENTEEIQGKAEHWAMTRKKAKANKSAEKKPAKKKSGAKKQADPAQVREQLAGIVKSGAKGITRKMMDQAMNGDLAPAKYLLEMAGVYPPASEDELTIQEEDCLAKTLLDRLNLSPKPAANAQESEEKISPAQDADEEEDNEQGGDDHDSDEVHESSEGGGNKIAPDKKECESLPE
jgi:hypothetical protein